jgi:tRNA(Ile)-lysidine synthase
MKLSRKIMKFITERNLIPAGSHVMAALSGGADSTAMLYLLSDLADELSLRLSAAHFDHGIRPEAARERVLVEKHCERLGVPLLCGSGDVPGQSRLRRRADAVALGHTRNDQVETILHRIIRGTGWRGAAGIAAGRGIFIRPLLGCQRDEIERFLGERGIRWATDASNMDNRLLRNRIRNRLLPYLRTRFNPSIDEAIVRMGENLDEGRRLLERFNPSPRPSPGGASSVRLSNAALAGLGDFEIYLLVDSILRDGFGLMQDVEKSHLDAVKRLIRRGRSGAAVELPHGVRCERDQRGIRLTAGKRAATPPAEFIIPGPGTYAPPGWKIELRVALEPPPSHSAKSSAREAYLAAVRFPLRLRRRRSGDRMQPFGMRGRKKLSDILIDRKVPAHRREALPVLEDPAGIVWVPGCATAERTRIRPTDRSVLHIALARTAPDGPKRTTPNGPGGTDPVHEKK